MKSLGPVLVFMFIGIGFWGGYSSVLAESLQDGSIVGVVEEREQKDNDRTMAIDLKSAKLAFYRRNSKTHQKVD